jgi:hypothetical protein
MNEDSQLTRIAQPVVELPVADVERAQQHYCSALGFKVAWLLPDKSLGAVSREKAAIFLRKTQAPFSAINLWVFAPDIEATLRELQSLDANIIDPLEKKPWGMTQFTVQDIDGHRLTFHHDL